MTSSKKTRKYGDIVNRPLQDSSNVLSEVFERLVGKSPSPDKVLYPDQVPYPTGVPFGDEKNTKIDTIPYQGTVPSESTAGASESSKNPTVPSHATVPTQGTVPSDVIVSDKSGSTAKNLEQFHTKIIETESEQITTVPTKGTIPTKDTVPTTGTVPIKDTVENKTTVLPNESSKKISTEINNEINNEIKTRPSPNRVPLNKQYSDRVRYPMGTVSKEVTVPSQDAVPIEGTVSTVKKGYLQIPNSVADDIASSLLPFEWAVYFRLFRLSHGWGKDTCLVGVQRLIELTNISENQIRRTLKTLQEKGLVEVLEIINTKEIKGTKYKVNTVPRQSTVPFEVTVPSHETVPQRVTVPPQAPNKDHDHEDLKIHDHHQNEVMTIYTKLTGKKWSKADQKAYEQINQLPVEQLIAEMRAISERSSAPIGSFAYFVTSIKNAIAEGKGTGQAGQSTARRRIEEWAVQLRQAHVGDPNYSISDLSADLKDRCAREGIEYTVDLINEIINRR